MIEIVCLWMKKEKKNSSVFSISDFRFIFYNNKNNKRNMNYEFFFATI